MANIAATKMISRRNFIKGVIAAGARVFGGLSVPRLHSAGPGIGSRRGRAADHAQRQRPAARRGRHEAGDAGEDAALQAGPDRHQARLRPRRMRRLHGADRRCAALLCSMLTHTVRGRKVMTIEGLASADGKLHPVQQGVVDEQGFQCAFCMSGFMMAAVGFLKTNPNPTRAELAHGISGNLCRCQDYDKILTAMMRGAENMRRAEQWLAKSTDPKRD